MNKLLPFLLLLTALLEAIGGLALVFGTGWFVALQPAWLHSVSPSATLAILKFLGLFALMLAYLSYVTSRDPVRYIAVIDSLIFLLLGAVVIDLWILLALHAAPFYPVKYVVARSLVRIVLAVVFIVLRPRRSAITRAPGAER